MFSISDTVKTIIEKRNNIQDLPSLDILLNNLKETNRRIIEIVDQNNDPILKEFYQLHKKYEEIEEKIALKRRIDTGTTTLLFFVYSIGGAFIGLFFSISVFLTTIGTLGHILLLLSMTGGIISVVVGLISMKRERRYILSLIKRN
ncbi:MAG: hypothetical protein ACP5NL_05080 [Thermoplasmata archaeon]